MVQTVSSPQTNQNHRDPECFVTESSANNYNDGGRAGGGKTNKTEAKSRREERRQQGTPKKKAEALTPRAPDKGNITK